MSVSEGTKQYLALILALLVLSSNSLWAMFAWSYSGLAADVKQLNRSVPLLEDRQTYMAKVSESDKALLKTLEGLVTSQERNAALLQQRLVSIEEQIKHIKGFMEYYSRGKP